MTKQTRYSERLDILLADRATPEYARRALAALASADAVDAANAADVLQELMTLRAQEALAAYARPEAAPRELVLVAISTRQGR